MVLPSSHTPASFVLDPLSAFSEGNQVFPSSLSTLPETASLRLHSAAVKLSREAGRQASPLPSMTPVPVIATFSSPSPEMGDWHLTAGRPSQLPFTRGY